MQRTNASSKPWMVKSSLFACHHSYMGPCDAHKQSFYYAVPMVAIGLVGWSSKTAYQAGLGGDLRAPTVPAFGVMLLTNYVAHKGLLVHLDKSADMTPVRTLGQFLSRSGPWGTGAGLTMLASFGIMGLVTRISSPSSKEETA